MSKWKLTCRKLEHYCERKVFLFTPFHSVVLRLWKRLKRNYTPSSPNSVLLHPFDCASSVRSTVTSGNDSVSSSVPARKRSHERLTPLVGFGNPIFYRVRPFWPGPFPVNDPERSLLGRSDRCWHPSRTTGKEEECLKDRSLFIHLLLSVGSSKRGIPTIYQRSFSQFFLMSSSLFDFKYSIVTYSNRTRFNFIYSTVGTFTRCLLSASLSANCTCIVRDEVSQQPSSFSLFHTFMTWCLGLCKLHVFLVSERRWG